MSQKRTDDFQQNGENHIVKYGEEPYWVVEFAKTIFNNQSHDIFLYHLSISGVRKTRRKIRSVPFKDGELLCYNLIFNGVI